MDKLMLTKQGGLNKRRVPQIKKKQLTAKHKIQKDGPGRFAPQISRDR